MITRFITNVSLTFNPFSARAKVCRTVLSQFGPAAWGRVKFDTKVLPRESTLPSGLKLKFRTWIFCLIDRELNCLDSVRKLTHSAEDGKELTLDTEKLNFKDITEEVDRHSRGLARKAELSG